MSEEKEGQKVYAVLSLPEQIIRGTITKIFQRRETDGRIEILCKNRSKYWVFPSMVFPKKPRRVILEDCYGRFTRWEG